MSSQPISPRQKIRLVIAVLLVPVVLLGLAQFLYEHHCTTNGAACKDGYQQPVSWETDGTWGKLFKKIF